MAGELRFHLDEHVAQAVAEGLRRRGIDVTTTHDAGLSSASDVEHMAYALHEGRVIVTNDDDFLRMNGEGVRHAGIAYYDQERHSIGYLVRRLVALWETLTAEEMIDRVQYI